MANVSKPEPSETNETKTRRKNRKLTSPEVDDLVYAVTHSARTGGAGLWGGPTRSVTSESEQLFKRVTALRDLLERIQPNIIESDLWLFWLRTNRGSVEDFGDYQDLLEAGEVESQEEFESLWKTEYPEAVQWRRSTVVSYDERLFFTLQGDLSFNVNLSSGVFEGVDVTDETAAELIFWLLEAIIDEARRVVLDADAYNLYIEQELPLSKRFGRIYRRDIWDRLDEKDKFSKTMGRENIEKFERIVRDLDDEAKVASMSLGDFLGYCEICYDANAYKNYPSDASPKDKYKAMADNRHEGLLDLPLNDPEAFAEWHKNRVGGGHPWEICRGGNSTHISLYVMSSGAGWQFCLSGFSTTRVVETAKMAIALFERGVPFVLAMKEEMLQMLAGRDFVGIVPDDIGLGYNHEEFPTEDRVYSFAHLWMIEDLGKGLVEKILWYPFPRFNLGENA